MAADFFSKTEVKYSIETPDGKALGNHAKLHDLCGGFIDDNQIEDEYAIVPLTVEACGFVKKICELIGYHESERDEGRDGL